VAWQGLLSKIAMHFDILAKINQDSYLFYGLIRTPGYAPAAVGYPMNDASERTCELLCQEGLSKPTK
jgi:hypothetical protein